MGSEKNDLTPAWAKETFWGRSKYIIYNTIDLASIFCEVYEHHMETRVLNWFSTFKSYLDSGEP